MWSHWSAGATTKPQDEHKPPADAPAAAPPAAWQVRALHVARGDAASLHPSFSPVECSSSHAQDTTLAPIPGEATATEEAPVASRQKKSKTEQRAG